MSEIKIENYTFKPVGVDGVYICDRAILKAPFDKDGCNDWEKSSGKKLLEQWFKEHAPAEIQEQFDIDLPTVEEVFSQKMINWWGGDSVKGLVSKQFPIFKDSDERMKEFEGKPTWWWTRSAYAGSARNVWHVYTDGSLNYDGANITYGFVPVLRRKQPIVNKKKLGDLTLREIDAICREAKRYEEDDGDACEGCPLNSDKVGCMPMWFGASDATIEREVDLGEENLSLITKLRKSLGGN